MNSLDSKSRQTYFMNNKIRHIDICRENDKTVEVKGGLNEPCLWKKELEINEKAYLKDIHKKKNKNMKKQKKQKNINEKLEKNEDIYNVNSQIENNDLEIARKKLAVEIMSNLWNKLDVENEGVVDLFNDNTFLYFSETEKKIFRNNFLSYFIACSENSTTIKNDIFDEYVDLSYKNERNINELKRIAIEKESCLLVNCNKEDLLSNIKPILIVSKEFFFKTINEIVMNVDCLNTNKNTSLVLKLLNLSKNVHNSTNNVNIPYTRSCNFDENDYEKSPETSKIRNDANMKVGYSIKEYFPIKKKTRILMKEDYEIIEKENIINDSIHQSIVELSKNVKLEDIKEKIKAKQNDRKLIKHKLNNEKIYASILNNKNTYGYDPLKILKSFLDKDSNILNYKDFLDELRCCTFQPNVHKYIEQEKKYRKEKKKKEKNENFKNKSKNENEEKWNNDTCDFILKSLKKPDYDIDNIDMTKYLKSFEMYSLDKEKKVTPLSLTYENPTHRVSRSDFRRTNNLNKNCVEMKKKKTSINVGSKNKWVNELRGGYRSTTFKFSLEDEDEKKLEIERSNKAKNIDWDTKIRLTRRRMKTRVIPNSDLVNKMVNIDYTYEEEPTKFVVKQKGVLVYDNSSQKSIHKGPPKKVLLTSFQHKKECEKNNNGTKTDHSVLFQKTNFFVPTPIKTHKQNRLLRIKNELKNFGELTSFAPPKVIAVESATLLDDIKNEILALPQSVRFLEKNKNYRNKN